jgi:hypothetical protein
MLLDLGQIGTSAQTAERRSPETFLFALAGFPFDLGEEPLKIVPLA